MSVQYKAVGARSLVDEGSGIVTALVSVTGIVDNVNDVIEPGAYTKSLAKRKPKGVWHHSWEKAIAKTLEVEELLPLNKELPSNMPDGSPWPKEAGALRVKMQFNLNTPRGRDAYEDVKFFADEQEWSIGYNVPPNGATRRDGKRYIKSLELYEYSPVLFGAMANARTVSIKSAQEAFRSAVALKGDDAAEFLMEIKSIMGDDDSSMTLEGDNVDFAVTDIEVIDDYAFADENDDWEDELPESKGLPGKPCPPGTARKGNGVADLPEDDEDEDGAWFDEEDEDEGVEEKSIKLNGSQLSYIQGAVEALSLLLESNMPEPPAQLGTSTDQSIDSEPNIEDVEVIEETDDESADQGAEEGGGDDDGSDDEFWGDVSEDSEADDEDDDLGSGADADSMMAVLAGTPLDVSGVEEMADQFDGFIADKDSSGATDMATYFLDLMDDVEDVDQVSAVAKYIADSLATLSEDVEEDVDEEFDDEEDAETKVFDMGEFKSLFGSQDLTTD